MMEAAVPFPFPSSATLMVSGGTGSGKTTWVARLLREKNLMFEEPPRHILYCYGVYQQAFDRMKQEVEGIIFHEGLPTSEDIESLTKNKEHTMVVLDDLMGQVVKEPEAELLFTQGAHHRHMTVLFISQNLFSQGKCARTIALNTHFLVLFRNFRDHAQIMHLGRQLYPGAKCQGFMTAYEQATHRPYGYLVLDMSPHSQVEEARLRTDVFAGERTRLFSLI